MSSDFSRQRFQPVNDFSGVLMQQGRVQLDADWNEWNDLLDRRSRSGTVDTIGRAVVPRETPDGFAVALVSGKTLTVGRGRIYVDGLQAENHGAGALEFDPVLAESRGTAPVQYDQQPYFPNPPALPAGGGPHLVYLDVWSREVTAVEDPGLVENAVGVDTTTRLQTAWQVRVLPNVGAGVTCATPDEQIPGWLDLVRSSAGRLTTAAVGVATTDDPCLVPPTGGYRGLENRLYRVEIHDGGPVGTATFKWSRDNASVAANVSRIEGGVTLTADRVAWDSVRRFSADDWVEVTDDVREFSGAPGDLRRVVAVVDATRTIKLGAPLTAGSFQVDGQSRTDPGRHTRIKRWDQAGLVRDAAGGTFLNLDAAGGQGLIPVPPAGTSLLLEDGVQVTWTTAAPDGSFRTGDYWTFAARTADASVEVLNAAPPRGVHHHFCRLALVTFPDSVVDCRTFWPPTPVSTGEGCACTVCVEADAHNQGTFTIQQAVDQVRATGGTVCLGPGHFNLVQSPVRLEGAFAVCIRGQGAATVVIQPRAEAAFILRRSVGCTLDSLSIVTGRPEGTTPAVRIGGCLSTTVERLIIGPIPGSEGPFAGVLLESGALFLTKIRDCSIRARNGVVFLSAGKPTVGTAPPAGGGEALLLGGFYCEDNTLLCRDTGIFLVGSIYYFDDAVFARNLISSTATAGIALNGLGASELDITDNTLSPADGDGVVLGGAGARISGNEVVNLLPDKGGPQHGIRLVPGLLQSALVTVEISENRLSNLRGDAISVESLLLSAKIERNIIASPGGNGLTVTKNGEVINLTVTGNEFINVAPTAAGSPDHQSAGIHLRNVFQGAVTDNIVSGVGTKTVLAGVLAGVRLDACWTLRLSDNTITNVAPATRFAGLGAGVLVTGPLSNLEIADNLIRRQLLPTDNTDKSNWQAVQVGGAIERDSDREKFTAFKESSTHESVWLMDRFATARVTRTGSVGVHGNALQGYGNSPLVEVKVAGTCRFHDNDCVTPTEGLDAAVALAALSLIASANHVGCAPKTRGLELRTGSAKNLTVFGNITGGPITVNDQALPAPWQGLNVLET